jgi:glycosyltransferase involved in cell wall biosynthesis
MPSITALLHTFNHARQLGRALETLYPCDEILIVDHNSIDDTLRIAREYGARVIPFRGETEASHYLQSASSDWILCLEPCESLSEALAASLFEWKLVGAAETVNFLDALMREEAAQGWIDSVEPETRLVPRNWAHWRGWLPVNDPSFPLLEGDLLEGRLLRFSQAT